MAQYSPLFVNSLSVWACQDSMTIKLSGEESKLDHHLVKGPMIMTADKNAQITFRTKGGLIRLIRMRILSGVGIMTFGIRN